MEKIQTIKLIFGILLGTGTIVLGLLTYFLGWKKWYISKKACTEKVQGKVVKYTIGSRSKHAPIHLPVVEYVVNGKKYKVVGPKYKAVVEKYKSTFTSINQTDVFDPTEDVLYLELIANSGVSLQTNPFETLFPKESTVDVYYDPKHPKKAYVLRYTSEKFKFYILLLGTIIVFAMLLLVLFKL